MTMHRYWGERLKLTTTGGMTGVIPVWGSPVEVTLSGDGIAVVTKEGYYTIGSYSGETDDFTKITGLNAGDEVLLRAVSGETITVKNGSFMKLQGATDFVLNDQCDNITLVSLGSDICMEKGRASNG